MDSYGDLIMRCPRLGGEVRFAYCEREAGELPCRMAIRCWATGFPVEEHLRRRLSPAQWERFCSQVPKDKLASLLDIAEAVKRRQKGAGPGEAEG